MLIKLILVGLLLLALSSYADAPTMPPMPRQCDGLGLGGTCYTMKLVPHTVRRFVA